MSQTLRVNLLSWPPSLLRILACLTGLGELLPGDITRSLTRVHSFSLNIFIDRCPRSRPIVTALGLKSLAGALSEMVP